MRAYFRCVLRFRVAILLGMLVCCVASALVLPRAVISSSLGKLFLGESAAYADYKNRVQRFGSEEVLIIVVEEDDLLSGENLRKLRQAVVGLREIPEVDRVDSLLDAQHIWGTGDDDFVTVFDEEVARYPERAREVLEELTTDPFTGGLLIAADGGSAAVIITLDPTIEHAIESQIDFVERAVAIFHEAGYRPEQIRRAGAIAVLAEMISLTHFNLKRLFPLVCALLVVAVWLLFRQLWPVIVSMTVAFVAVLWTVALCLLFDREVSIMITAIPAVILIIAFSDVIHLCSAYLLELREHGDKEEAILRSAEDVGSACVFTSLTTFVGFVCLAMVPTPVMRQLGLALGVGVGLALLIAMTLVPILFSYLPEPKAWSSGTRRRSTDLLDGLLSATSRLGTRRPLAVLIGFAVLLVVSIVGITRIDVETDITRRLDPENPIRRDVEVIDRQYASSNVIDIYVDLKDGATLLDPEIFAAVSEYGRALERLPDIDKVVSVVTILDNFRRRIEAVRPDLRGRQPTRADLQQLFTQLDLFSGQRIDPLISPELDTLRFILRLSPRGLRESWETGEAARRLGESQLDERFEVRPTGMVYLMGAWLGEILIGQQRGLLLSSVVIALIMMLALRSISAGLWSMLPNLLPLLVLGGWIGWTWDQVDSDTIMVAILAIGIGVDDTIHFLMRLRIESRRTATTEEAIRRSFWFAGRGIVITTAILVVGFLPFNLSDYFSLKILGSLLPLVLVVALLADLLLVPALARLGLLRWRPGEELTRIDGEPPRAMQPEAPAS